MASPDPTITIADGGGAAQATTNGVNVTPGNVVTVALSNSAGVNSWALIVASMDDVTAAPVLTINALAKTATFTAPAAGAAIRLQSAVIGATAPGNSTTAGAYTLTAGGKRVLAVNETTEGSAASGWIVPINSNIRSGGGAGTVTWANDLAGSTSTNQYVVSLTGSAGVLSVLAGTFSWVDGIIPRLQQTTAAGTGVNGGIGFTVSAQAGQQQTGVAANNNGGNLNLTSGPAGTGGSGAAGVAGSVNIKAGGTTVGSFAAAASDFLSFGASPSLTGVLRLASNVAIKSRNAANSADLNAATYNGSDQFLLGDSAAATVIVSSGGGTFLRGTALQIQPVSGAINAWSFSGLASGATALTVDASLLTPTITQTAAVAAQTPASIFIAPQTFNAGSTTAVANTPGSFVVNVTAPGTNTVAGAEAGIKLQRAGTTLASMQAWFGGSTYGALYLGAGIVPSATNAAIFGNGSATFVSASSNVSTRVNGTDVLVVSLNSIITAANTSLSINGAASLGGGVGVLGMLDATTAPSSNPTGGYVQYSTGGVPGWRTAAGSIFLLDATTATTATLGANGAPPAQVSQYLIVHQAGTLYKIPMYLN